MVKSTGSTNYKLVEIDRLLDLVEGHLPLGKDEWERLAGVYNSSRARGWSERDFESLRRKFKVLYSTRKPTGTATMPPHILKAKILKKEIDAKANVIEMNDAADEENGFDDQDAEARDRPNNQPDFCFDADPDESCYSSRDGDDGGAFGDSGDNTVSHRCDNASRFTDGDSGAAADATSGASVDGFQELLSMELDGEGLQAFSSTIGPGTPRPQPTPRSTRSVELSRPSKKATPSTPTLSNPPTGSSTASKKKSGKKPAARGYKAGTRDEQEALRYDKMLDYSNRLGGTDLFSFRDNVGAKRAREDDDTEMVEASFAKVKRMRAAKATTALKKKLGDAQGATDAMGSSMFEMMLLLREENERKAEARREDEDRRRREEKVAKEIRIAAEKAEAEERRRQYKLEMDERARRDKDDARARTQELILLIGALSKKE